MKKRLLTAILPAFALFGLAGLASCNDYSPDEPFPPTYTASVFTGSNNQMVYSVDLKSGKMKWETPVDGEVHATPVLFQGSLWVGTNTGNFYQIDYKTGK